MVSVISETGTTRSFKQITEKKKKRIKLDHYFMPYTKNNAQEITGLNVKSTTIKYLQQNIGEYLNEVSYSAHKQP